MNTPIRDHVLEAHCGCLQNKGGDDAVLPLKAALQLWKEHGIEFFVVFVDFVMVFDTVNHQLMLLCLQIYGLYHAYAVCP